MWDPNWVSQPRGVAVQLITYTDRLGGDLPGVYEILENEFEGLFDGVHILPFFHPIDGADAGFDPIDHRQVDPRLGDWSNIAEIAKRYGVMADLIVNHVSAQSQQFADVRKNGPRSAFWPLFLKKTDVFESGAGNEADMISKIYRPRPGLPFTTLTLDDGSAVDFWTTFSANQLDINVESPGGQLYLDSILHQFAAAGVTEIRLDAAGYAIKRAGTSCFMLPETFEFIGRLAERARDLGMESLVEIHSHYQTQIAIASQVGRVYDFALPPLVLHTLYSGSAVALKRWLQIAPRNCVTVLDTHDGIGIMDAAGEGDLDGLLGDAEIDALVETIHEKTGGNSKRASGHAASNLDIYQVNSTYFDALGRDERDYLIARALQFFSPGEPQVYYVGLLAGGNDMELVERTSVGRDINRHYYSRQEIREELQRPVVDALLSLIRLRRRASAFDGSFSLPACPDQSIVLRWDAPAASASLSVDLRARVAEIELEQDGTTRRYTIDDKLLTRSPS